MLKLYTRLLQTKAQAKIKCMPVRNVQVSVIGAAGELGSNVSLLLKQNHKIKRLQLYDDDEKVIGAAIELNHLPGGAIVSGFAGDDLNEAIRSSQLILMVHRIPRKPGKKREAMIAANAPSLHKLCRAMADENPDAFLAIASNPINSMVPFASSILYKYGIYNPFKVFGITQIDINRTRACTAKALKVSSNNLFVPVIGGHSDETIIPLFSYMTPVEYTVDPCQADSLTHLVRKIGTEIVFRKQGTEAAVAAVAWSINEFCDSLIDAINGNEVDATCYIANPYFGTRFFAGHSTIGPYGVIRPFRKIPLNDYETFLVNRSVPIINSDVSLGEDHVKILIPKL
ncbi:hypothetical protein PYW08_015482 [Mythimna loreyi]|uniref:Uncharacterized protein n=1 Tax=Mythimna loreyi TaxID=667449 RepID=A0ACC2QVR7_9NEOP|nr:hypothetical protein PYW08_015482 [Mythimna loreyi]